MFDTTDKSTPARPAYRLLAALLVIFLTACAAMVRTEYQRPALDLPDRWQTQSETGAQMLAADRWWQMFDDPQLDRLIALALKTNNDLAAAAIKVRKARLQAGLDATNRTPDLAVGANTGTQRDLESGGSVRSTSASASLTWELDLWGKLAGSRNAADWEARATEEDRAAAALALIGTTADLYWQIAYLNQAIRTGQESVAYAGQTLDLVRAKFEAGAVSDLDRLLAEKDLESQKADLADLEQQMIEVRNGLAILFDQAPGQLMAGAQALDDLSIPAVAAGIPVSVLSNRPDLKAVEMRLHATLEEANVTRAGYYPRLSLTSSLGTSSAELLNLLRNPVAALGADLALPFVQWNQARLNTRIAEAAYEQAVVEFRQTLYEALKDVENALAARSHYLTREGSLRRTAVLAQKTERLAEIRYRAGQTGVQEWLDAQQGRRTAQLALANNRYDRLKNMMSLCQALGGGQIGKK